MKICYVSSYLEINRENWNTKFKRSFDDYLKYFKPFIELFSYDNLEKYKLKDIEYNMILYMDSTRINQFLDECDISKSNISIILINNAFMEKNIPIWNRLETETNIMNSNNFKNLLNHRINCPEANNPKYTLINHSKIDFIVHTINNVYMADNYAWVDFGYFIKSSNIPLNMIDPYRFANNKINYTLIDMFDYRNANPILNIVFGQEKIGGFFFYGNKDVMLKYQKIYHKYLDEFQNMSICDDDQSLVLYMFFKINKTDQDILYMHYTGVWHYALKYFQFLNL